MHTWRAVITAKPVVCFRGNFFYPSICRTYYRQNVPILSDLVSSFKGFSLRNRQESSDESPCDPSIHAPTDSSETHRTLKKNANVDIYIECTFSCCPLFPLLVLVPYIISFKWCCSVCTYIYAMAAEGTEQLHTSSKNKNFSSFIRSIK